MATVKMLFTSYPKIEKAECIEDVLCLSTLIANGELSPNGTLSDSQTYFKDEVKEDCGNCPFMLTCLACIINE